MSNFLDIDWKRTRLYSNVDFVADGQRCGDVMFKHSDNQIALGNINVPVGVMINGKGPTVLMTAGVHGDEFEGPVALMKFLQRTRCEDIQGRLIVFPALNSPAVRASARVSPLDNANLNRAFPGDCAGTPTQLIADFIENSVMPVCDAVIDLHAGGKASWFEPCAMAMNVEKNLQLTQSNFDLADAFGCPLVWVMGQLNDRGSVNAAAFRNKIPSVAAELGGGGQVSPQTLGIGERGITNCLQHLGMLAGSPAAPALPIQYVEIQARQQQIHSPASGIFEPVFEPGDHVSAGDRLGWIHDIEEIKNPPRPVSFTCDGIAFIRGHRGLVTRGELLAVVGKVLTAEQLAKIRS